MIYNWLTKSTTLHDAQKSRVAMVDTIVVALCKSWAQNGFNKEKRYLTYSRPEGFKKERENYSQCEMGTLIIVANEAIVWAQSNPKQLQQICFYNTFRCFSTYPGPLVRPSVKLYFPNCIFLKYMWREQSFACLLRLSKYWFDTSCVHCYNHKLPRFTCFVKCI